MASFNNKLPVIDFTKDDVLSPGTEYWLSIQTQVVKALEEYGCFEAMYDNKVSLKLHNEMFSAAEEVLDLPLETKMLNTSNKPYHGYFNREASVRPLFENIGIDDAHVLDQVCNFTSLMWPEGNHCFSEAVHTFAKRVTELNQIVTRMIFENYEVEQYYDSHIELMNYLFKVMRYRKPRVDVNNSVYPHTDKSFISVLHQNHVDGLEIETKNGDWIRVKQSPASFIVMTGDAFLAWSNGRLRCPIHRVVIEEDDMRYSIGLFGNSQKLVEVPSELVDEEHPLKFKPFCQMDLINFYLTEEGQKAESTVKAYCGI
ncbi:hypothetical protein MKW92_033974 [Papaver armeniacum]|nr:hypothetical protein MKW92_033974 [Papaver armeniacum]